MSAWKRHTNRSARSRAIAYALHARRRARGAARADVEAWFARAARHWATERCTFVAWWRATKAR
jgi:hypothetical protein